MGQVDSSKIRAEFAIIIRESCTIYSINQTSQYWQFLPEMRIPTLQLIATYANALVEQPLVILTELMNYT